MERALKKRMYIYTGVLLVSIIAAVAVITIYYEYRLRYMVTSLYGQIHRQESSYYTYYFMVHMVIYRYLIIQRCYRRQDIQPMGHGICFYMEKYIYHFLL